MSSGAVGLALLIAAAVVYVVVARRVKVPCPPWMNWGLDNRFMSGLASEMFELLALGRGMKALDAGCGPGRLSVVAARAVSPTGEVTALDVQPEMIARARENARGAGLENVRFIEGGLGEGRIGQGLYDAAFMVSVLGEIRDPEAAFRELYDALRPGGMLAITEVILDPHYQRRSTVRRLTHDVGFAEKACVGNWVAFTMTLEKPPTAG